MWDQDYNVLRATITEVYAIGRDIMVADHDRDVKAAIAVFTQDQKNSEISTLQKIDDKIVLLLAYRALIKNPDLIK